jgi:Ca2+-binding RTX toxin-like protein
VIVGEATVTQNSADPCAGTTGTSSSGGGASSTSQACPTGATLDVTANACVIIFNGKTIYVSQPFKGPSGGTVLPLSVARQKYGGPCTTGPGPGFALVATKPFGRVEGTPRSDRIIALGVGERVAGLAGNDCIEGRGGHGQKLYDGNGKDRVYGGPGSNRIGLGNGNDYINGRSGSGDFISAGNGNDVVHGGHGKTRIAVGIGRDHVYGGPGANHIWAVGDNAKINCGTGTHNQAWVRVNAAPFAKSHGCQKIHLLKR